MNNIYELQLPRDDVDGANVEPRGILELPHLDCPACGVPASGRDLWYASLHLDRIESSELSSMGMPRLVSSAEEFAKWSDKVKLLLKSNRSFPPGSVIGSVPLRVYDDHLIGGITKKKLEDGIDFISSGSNWIVSDRICTALGDHGLLPTANAVVFHTDERDFSGYHVLELEPVMVWTSEDHVRYQVKTCSVCGAVLKARRGTFIKKHFKGSLFQHGAALVRGLEDRGFYINDELHRKLCGMDPSGISFGHAGEWVGSQ